MSARSPARPSSAVRLVLALVAVFALMRFPGRPEAFSTDHLLRWPLELPLLTLGCLIVPRRVRRALASVLVAALGALVLLRLADLGSRLAFGRAFSPLADLHLFGHGWTLASQSVGRGQSLTAATIAAVALALLLWWIRLELVRLGTLGTGARRALLGASVAGVLVGGTLFGVQKLGDVDLGLRADLAGELASRVAGARRAVADQVAFAAELADDPLEHGPAPRFGALAGLDVIVLFVESYGRSYVDSPRFAGRSDATLERFGRTVDAAGLHVRSAWLDSPIRGGRSWLAHASFASGLALTNQARFDRLIGSSRRPLGELFEEAGWTSATVLPIVAEPWVEGAWYDVDRFFDGPSLGYRGTDFGYVTMPDQYTLWAFESRVRATAEAPLYAVIGLLGSHAPWTPLAHAVDWHLLGDGRVFDGTRRSGSPLDWAEPEPVRDAYARSLELTFARLGEYLERYGDGAVFLVLGDHQPASVIDGWGPNANVPLHVIAADDALLERLPAKHFTRGAKPSDAKPALPMAAIRELLARRFEAPPTAPAPATVPITAPAAPVALPGPTTPGG